MRSIERALIAALALAVVAQPQTAAAAEELTEVVVTGRRVSEAAVAIGTDAPTATVSITREALLSAPAGITGLKMLEGLPGFNVQANDALGMYEFGNSVSVRAFTFRQIGFLLDGIPLGRSDQFGGSPIYRYVDNENLLRVTASAGSGDVTLPSYASLGPLVNYLTVAPAHALGFGASQTFGSDKLRRTALRVDTGNFGPLSAYVSGSKVKGDLWRGPGTIDREHYEGKVRYDVADTTNVTLQAAHNEYFDFDSPAISLAQYAGTTPAPDPFGRSGRDFSYVGFVPTLAQTTPGVQFSNTAYNQYYKQAINSRNDSLFGLTLESAPAEGWRLGASAYYEDKAGYGVSPEAYATSLSSYNAERLIVPGLTAPRGLQYGLSTIAGERKGALASLGYQFSVHTLTATAWVEQDGYHRTQARYNQTNGDPSTAPLLDEPVHLQRDFRSTRDSRQLALRDVIALFDERLKLELGAKALDIDYRIEGYRNPADYINRRQPRIDDQWDDNFLPQVGAVLEIGARSQIFASYSENLALPQGADDIFSAASPATPGPQAERARNVELGIRSNQATFNAALVGYHTNFDNRLQSYASVVPGTTTTETFFQNVGGVEAWGLELSGQWKPELLGGKVYFNSNASWNHAEFEDGFATLAIAGNTLPDFPEYLVQGGVTFEVLPSIVVNVNTRYISSRYSNYTNAERVGGYAVYNAYVDFGDGFGFGPLKEIKARVNVDNLFDRDYLGTITPATNTAATFRPGPPRTVQVTLSASL